MKKQTRLVDTSARMTLFRDFAGVKVTLERIGSDEIAHAQDPGAEEKIRFERTRGPNYGPEPPRRDCDRQAGGR